MTHLDYRQLLGHHRRHSLRFSEFLAVLEERPAECLRTSSSLISEAIRHFGFEITVRSGEPTLSYTIFRDPFAGGTNAVFGQEFCIKQLVDVIDSVGKESGPNRGLVLVGPPASGKTNIVDLVSLALEEFTRERDVALYSFYFTFGAEGGAAVEVRPPFWHNPVLLVPTSLQQDHQITHPRRALFDHLNRHRGKHDQIVFPTYYQNASLDKRSLDILEGLLVNPRNRGKALFDIIEEHVRVEPIEFSNAQAKGIANIDDMRQLRVRVQPFELGGDRRATLDEHLPGAQLAEYQGATVAANRGLLHIHDAFGDGNKGEEDYKPLLMLLGSGKASIESTQAAIDTTVILTTNLEEMAALEKQLTSSKLLDRIEEVPVNYLLDANAEMEILRRDLANMRERFDVDPNLLRVAASFAVLTRLLPPRKTALPEGWSAEKRALFLAVRPEQKLTIYSARPEDPVATVRRLPHWHPFRGELIKLRVDLHDDDTFPQLFARSPGRSTLEQAGVFTAEELKLVDDEFMRELWNEHYPHEGKHGLSVRQLQNVMRDTIARSAGLRIHVGTFFGELKRTFGGSPGLHHWHPMDAAYREGRPPVPLRFVGELRFAEGEGDYGDFKGLARLAQALYFQSIRREITVATVDRDPDQIALDLRRYLQHALLARAHENRAFAHVMVPRLAFVDPTTGDKVDRPDERFLAALEPILAPGRPGPRVRQELAQRFLDLQAAGELVLEEGKTAVASRQDNLLSAFAAEYGRLLSHRRVAEAGADQLTEAFFLRQRAPERYARCPREVRDLADTVILNLERRFGYSKQCALDTVVFALRKGVVTFSDIIQ